MNNKLHLNSISIAIITASLIIYGSIVAIAPASAQEEAQTAEPTTDVNREEIRQKLKERLDKVVLGDEDDTATPSSQSAKPILSTYFGSVQSATNSSILVLDQNQQTHKIIITPDTTLNLFRSGRGNSEIEETEIETDWFAIGMGEFTQQKSLQATRITFTEDYTPEPRKFTIAGTITEIDDEAISISSDKIYSITIPEEDEYTLQIKSVTEPEFEDLTIKDKAIAILQENTPDEDEEETVPTYTLLGIYSYPSLNNPIAASNQITEATPSAQATQSAELNPEE